MWKALLLAIGVGLLVVGIECLMIDSVVWANSSQPTSPTNAYYSHPTPLKQYQPKEWMPWAMITGGAITVLYACSLQNVDPPSE